MDGWTTLLDPKLTRPYGIEELYKVCFEPLGWPGKGVVIGLGMIPECELQCCVPMDEGDPVVMVNRPRVNAGDDSRSYCAACCQPTLSLAKELTLKARDLNSPWGTQADDWVKIRGERLSKSTEGAAMGGHADATS
jgi:hypothetical protein